MAVAEGGGEVSEGIPVGRNLLRRIFTVRRSFFVFHAKKTWTFGRWDFGVINYALQERNCIYRLRRRESRATKVRPMRETPLGSGTGLPTRKALEALSRSVSVV